MLSIPDLDTVSHGTLTGGSSGSEVFQYCDPGTNPTSLYETNIGTVNIYPNPFTESTTIEFSNPTNELFYFSIYNSMGKLVRPIKEIQSNRLVVYKNELESGLYIIEVMNSNQFHRKRIIIK